MAQDPFYALMRAPVAGGTLAVALAGPPPGRGSATVLAIHGVASSFAVWRSVARGLAPSVSLLAPDLRGRGHSTELPGPFGLAAHVADLLAVLDDAHARQVLVVGHSLGGYVAAELAARHPERVTGVVLLDGGLAIPTYPAALADELVQSMVESALAPTRPAVGSVDEQVERWRANPAFADVWNDDVAAYARAGVFGHAGAPRAAVSEDAVRADLAELVRDETARGAVDRVTAPLTFIRARRPARDTLPAVPKPLVDSFAATHPRARVEEVSEANHYTLVLGAGIGPTRVAAAIADALAADPGPTRGRTGDPG